MPRTKRSWISQLAGSVHIISRTAGGYILFGDGEKEYFLKLLERFSSGFFVKIHAFSIMGNHFHILASGMESEAKITSEKELLRRYRCIFGKGALPPIGSYQSDGTIIPDLDGGIERLRERLGSISRFVQELKQTFSLWYNKRYDRKGYLWSDRFKGIIVSKGDAQLACSAYIDLNPLRANLVSVPDDYRWCSLGLWVRNPKRAKRLLSPLWSETVHTTLGNFNRYREFVYLSGGVKVEGKKAISNEIISKVIQYHGSLGIGDRFRYRVKNFSEGVSIGTHSFITSIQKEYNRKFLKPRPLLDSSVLFVTRVLRM